MAFNPPDFNLECDIYTGPWLGRALRLTVECNLAYGRRVQQNFQDFFGGTVIGATPVMSLLLPALTDVRSFMISANPDLVEVPRTSGRWYEVITVDDMSKGFPSEYRLAQIGQVSEYSDSINYPGLFWPVPMP